MTTKDVATVALRPFDAAEFLDDEETIAAYVSEAFASNDPGEMAEAVGTIARARGMTEVARQAGVSRESLYRALSSKGNPELTTLVNVMRACGIRLAVDCSVCTHCGVGDFVIQIRSSPQPCG